ncbi:MAG: autotransporter domain-containing protein [Pseudomonadota bacterium]
MAFKVPSIAFGDIKSMRLGLMILYILGGFIFFLSLIVPERLAFAQTNVRYIANSNALTLPPGGGLRLPSIAGNIGITVGGVTVSAPASATGADAVLTLIDGVGFNFLAAGATLTINNANVGNNAGPSNNILGGPQNDIVSLTRTALRGGAIELREGNNVVTLTDSALFGDGSRPSGLITALINNDRVTLTNAYISDPRTLTAVNLGDGANVLDIVTTSTDTIRGTNVRPRIDGNIVGGPNVDNFRISGATINGAVDLGSGDNVLSITDNARAGAITLGVANVAGDNSVTITGSTISSISFLSTGDNQLTLSGATFVTNGNIISNSTGNFTLNGQNFIGRINGRIILGNTGINAINNAAIGAGVITGDIAGGTGSDSITFESTTVGGAIVLAGTGGFQAGSSDRLVINNGRANRIILGSDRANLVTLSGASVSSISFLTAPGASVFTSANTINLIGNTRLDDGEINHQSGRGGIAINAASLTNNLADDFLLGDATGIGISNSVVLGGITMEGTIRGGTGIDKVTLVETNMQGDINLADSNDELNADRATISGDVNLGAGNNNVVLTSTVLQNGITTGNGNDVVSLDRSTITGASNFGDGDNQAMFSFTTIRGNTVFGGGNDGASFSHSTILANIDFSGGNNQVSFLNTNIRGDLGFGAGVDQVSLENSQISSTLDLGAGDDILTLRDISIVPGLTGGTGTDVVNIFGKTDVRTNIDLGTTSGDRLNISSGTTTLRQNLTTDILNVATNSALRVSSLSGAGATSTIVATSSVFNSGSQLILDNDANFNQSNMTFQNGTSLGVSFNVLNGVFVPSTLVTTGDLTFQDNIMIVPNISSGNLGDERYVIATAGRIITNNTTLQAQPFGLTIYDARVENNSVILNSSRVSAVTILPGSSDFESVAAIDAISLDPGRAGNVIISAIDTVARQGGEALSEASQQMAPPPSALLISTTTGVENSQSVVGQRQASLKTSGGGIATGNGELDKGTFWLKPFYYRLDQDRRNTKPGFELDGSGLLGAVDFNIDHRAILGIGGSYSRSQITNQDASRMESDVQSYGLFAYGNILLQDLILEGQIGANVSDYETRSQITFGGLNRTRKGDFKGKQYNTMVKGSYPHFETNHPTLKVIPSLALNYIHASYERYNEKGAGLFNRTVKLKSHSKLSIIPDMRLEYPIEKTFGIITAYTSTAVSYDFLSGAAVSHSSYQGSSTIFRTTGLRPSRIGGQINLGIDIVAHDGYAVSLAYRGEYKASSQAHGGDIRFSFKF